MFSTKREALLLSLLFFSSMALLACIIMQMLSVATPEPKVIYVERVPVKQPMTPQQIQNAWTGK